MRVVLIALADRVGAPLVGGLRREAQHPAGHRDGDVLGGEFTDQRVDHSGEHVAAEVRRRPPQDLVLLLQQLGAPAQLPQLGGTRRRVFAVVGG